MTGALPIRLLVAVFSHERFVGLRNVIRSVREFIPAAEIHVFDDRSADPRITEYLDAERRKGGLGWTGTHDAVAPGSNRLGGLYANLNRALELAVDEKYDLLLLLQDDHQVLWFDEAVLPDVENFFVKVEDALMLDPRFIRFTTVGRRYNDNSHRLALATPRGAFAVGFIWVSRAAAINFRFGDSERASSDHALACGKRAYQSRHAFVADTPVTVSLHLRPPWFRGEQWGKAARAEFLEEPLLRPLSKREVQIIRSCPDDMGVLAEDVVHRNYGIRSLLPHYYNAVSLDRYRQSINAIWPRFLLKHSIDVHRLQDRPAGIALPEKPRQRSRPLIRHRVSAIGRIMLLWESVKTGLFLLLVYPLVKVWMKRSSRSFLRQIERNIGSAAPEQPGHAVQYREPMRKC